MVISLILMPALLLAQDAAKPAPQSPASQNPPAQSAPQNPPQNAARPAPPPPPPRPAYNPADDPKVIYAIGLSYYRQLSALDLSPDELKMVEQAMNDAAAGKPTEDLNVWGPKIRMFAQARMAKAVEHTKAESTAYLEKAAKEPGAVKTDSGMVYRQITPGTGPTPKATDKVKVNYRGTLVNGTEFDSSYKRNQPAEFPVTGVIPCWTEGLQKMKVGEKAQLVCPSNLAYGDRGHPNIPGGSALIFDVELLGILPPEPPKAPAPTTTPEKSTAPPAPKSPSTSTSTSPPQPH